MRKTIKMPRILKINWVKELSVSVIFNNGESRIIDFRKVLNSLKLVENSPARILFKTEEFSKVELENNKEVNNDAIVKIKEIEILNKNGVNSYTFSNEVKTYIKVKYQVFDLSIKIK